MACRPSPPRPSRRPSARRSPQFGADEPTRSRATPRSRSSTSTRSTSSSWRRSSRTSTASSSRARTSARSRPSATRRPRGAAEPDEPRGRRHRRRRRHPARGRRPHAARALARRAVVGIEDGDGAATRVRAHRAPLGQGGAPRRPLHAVRDGRGRRGAAPRPAGPTSCRTTRRGSAAIIGTGIGGIGTLEHSTTCCASRGPKKVSPLVGPADDEQRRAPARCPMRYELRGHVATASSRPARRARTRSARRCA